MSRLLQCHGDTASGLSAGCLVAPGSGPRPLISFCLCISPTVCLSAVTQMSPLRSFECQGDTAPLSWSVMSVKMTTLTCMQTEFPKNTTFSQLLFSLFVQSELLYSASITTSKTNKQRVLLSFSLSLLLSLSHTCLFLLTLPSLLSSLNKG